MLFPFYQQAQFFFIGLHIAVSCSFLKKDVIQHSISLEEEMVRSSFTLAFLSICVRGVRYKREGDTDKV